MDGEPSVVFLVSPPGQTRFVEEIWYSKSYRGWEDWTKLYTARESTETRDAFIAGFVSAHRNEPLMVVRGGSFRVAGDRNVMTIGLVPFSAWDPYSPQFVKPPAREVVEDWERGLPEWRFLRRYYPGDPAGQ